MIATHNSLQRPGIAWAPLVWLIALSFGCLSVLTLSGCATQSPMTADGKPIAGRPPIRAAVFDEGTVHLGTVADQTGVFYLYDVNADESIYKVNASKGDRFVVDIDRDEMTWNGRPIVGHPHLHVGHRFKIYFLTSAQGALRSAEKNLVAGNFQPEIHLMR